MKIQSIYNLEFPSWCPELNIFGYRFTRVHNYEENLIKLHHLVFATAEFNIKPNTGSHYVTAFVEIPDIEKESIFDSSSGKKTALQDILLLLSIFTGREVFALDNKKVEEINENKYAITADPRTYSWGGTLRVSIPFKGQPIEPKPLVYDIGFEEGMNEIYQLIRSDKWKKEYKGGYFLLLAKAAFRRQNLEASFTQCWTILEHLFSILNESEPSSKKRGKTAKYKIGFLLRNFEVVDKEISIPEGGLKALVNIRNKLVHFGIFPKSDLVEDAATRLGITPEMEQGHQDSILVIRITEFIITKILGLSPLNTFDTVENLKKYLDKYRS